MGKVLYSLVFNRRKQLNKEGKALIQIEAYLDKKRKYFSTKVYIRPGQWDNNRKRIKNHPNSEDLNVYLMKCIADLEKMELDFITKDIVYSLSDISLIKLKESISGDSFLEFMKVEISRNNLKESTLKNHLSTLHLLGNFKEDIFFSELNYAFLCDFEYYLLQQKYNYNTISKHLKHIRRYLNLAIDKDLIEEKNNPFRKYKMKSQETKRIHLTPDELGRIEKLDLGKDKALDKCRDMYLFSCYTGLRFSDVVRIGNDNFFMIENTLWLIYSSHKTDVNVRLPLSLLFEGKAIPIYLKYCQNSGALFKVSTQTNSNINKQLKKIAKLAVIDKNISFHSARHTNATLLLYKGANITTVQKLLGHKNLQTTQIYGKIMDMTIVRDLERIENK